MGGFLLGTPFRLLAGGVEEQPLERVYWAMGTTVRFQVYHEDRREALEAVRRASDVIQAVHNRMSLQQADSLLSRWNRSPLAGEVVLDELTAGAVEAALGFRTLSGGRYDPTVGAAVSALQQGRSVPPQGERAVYWRRPGAVLEKSHPLVQLDLGGSAKGWAVDRAVEILQRHGVRAGLVNAGGDLRVFGCPPGSQGWPIGIRRPDQPDRLLTVLSLTEAAVATSSDMAEDGLSLLVDPRQLQPVHLQGSVSVVAPTCAEADAWSTALCVEPDLSLLPGSLSGLIAIQSDEQSLKIQSNLTEKKYQEANT
ncbi:MAG: FAD:protein FMN transferase [Calditrichaeota bacterium]|nr:MAG: FAD:protein FMN transferase [Calditrichota bacterium]